jgi:hypothetical protein
LFLVFLFLTPFTVKAIEKPIVYYSFDEIKGDVVKDLSGNGNDGKLENNPNIIDGKMGKALEFAESRVGFSASETMSSELFKNGLFTLVLWIKPKLTGNTWQQIFRAGPDPNDTLFVNNDGRISWRGWVGGAWAGGMCETDPGIIPKDKWTHVAVVGDAKNFRDYVDGKLAKETNFQATRGNNKEFKIGGYSGGESYSGAVDEFAIFKTPLKEAEINSIKDKGVLAITAVASKGKLVSKWAELKTIF